MIPDICVTQQWSCVCGLKDRVSSLGKLINHPGEFKDKLAKASAVAMPSGRDRCFTCGYDMLTGCERDGRDRDLGRMDLVKMSLQSHESLSNDEMRRGARVERKWIRKYG